MFVGAEEAGEVNQGELINPVVAVRLEDGVVWHVDYELENQHNTPSTPRILSRSQGRQWANH